ncbi:serpentine type 7TM GPCR chemoreceptor srt domain-containing protein [Ditylenchus destructor]|uniref:Serpentine type 7TM GPCR chemoreceptor srt domain-containing protein n=1 Tax=Ditylenchus destructor TaxID=166010 RepID=A0AAD4MM55_9BILA|nr:serpentine type 7TM GPCR chemoreceptor srt domain-containing protein [Ditylenchus destructor]
MLYVGIAEVRGTSNNSEMSNRTTDAASIPPPRNNFNAYPSLIKFDNYYDSYCTNGVTVLSEKNVLIGSFYIFEYLFYLSLYIPILIVIRRSPLYQHTSYKLMFAIGITDNICGLVFTFSAGVMSINGINYCDHNEFMLFISHICHGLWGAYTMFIMILALNRSVEMYSNHAAETMWRGSRLHFWMIPVAIWGLLFYSSWDVPPVYNSYYNTWIFEIDFRPGAPPVIDWICFLNSWIVIIVLVALYSFLFYNMRKRSQQSDENQKISAMQKKVFFQTSWICFTVFCVSITFGVASLVRIPPYITSLNTLSLHLTTGSPSVVYLLVNKKIRHGVKALIFESNRIKTSNSRQQNTRTTNSNMFATMKMLMHENAPVQNTHHNKVTIVGVGQVGMACAYSIL